MLAVNTSSQAKSDLGARRLVGRRGWLFSLVALPPVIVVLLVLLPNSGSLLANPQDAPPSGARPRASNCVSKSPQSLSLRCVSFSGQVYAVAEIDLRSQKIVFTVSGAGGPARFPEIFDQLSRAGVKPLLLTNAGIYGTDDRPLGLLISSQGQLHDAITKSDPGPAHGNFSWDSGIFQVADDGLASIVPAPRYRGSSHIVAATQSGPQLASAGKVNQSFPSKSPWSYRRTAIGIAQANPMLVDVVVSREPVTLFDLATFMVDELHCSDALHLDGDLSAFYVPSTPEKFLFSDPGQRIVTVLAVLEK